MKYLKWILVQFVLVCLGLALVEAGLRQYGFRPGDLRPNWLNFKEVDSLQIVPDYYMNEKGILVADSAYWAKNYVYVNSDGFRTKQFDQIDSTKKKVMFIGDSFTWGTNAIPLDSSFVDLVRSETEYEVVNLGIPTADPVQYYELAKMYVNELKPDIVIVAFFTGNDIMQQDRKVISSEPFYYFTNAGAIVADIDGKHFPTAQSAYNYFVRDKYYIHNPSNIFEVLISKCALLSRLYSVRFRFDEKIKFEQTVKDAHITKKYLNLIKQYCSENKVSLRFLLIPEIKDADMKIDQLKNRYRDLLIDKELSGMWLIPENKKKYFNDYPDGHLNNEGHRVYADFLESFLNQFFRN